MPASILLTTLENVKAYMSLDVTDSSQDSFLQTLISAVSEAVENYCGREFLRKTRVEYYDGRYSRSLVLRCRPAYSIVTIHDDISRTFDSNSILSADRYVLYEGEAIVRLRSGTFSDGLKNVRVEYDAGFSVVPAAVVQAATVLVSHFYTRARGGADGITSESVGVYTVSYDTGEWPHQVRGLLSEFREVNI